MSDDRSAASVPLRVSVCIPTYAPDETQLVETVASVLLQERCCGGAAVSIELVVADDASPGGLDLARIVAAAVDAAKGADPNSGAGTDVDIVTIACPDNVGMVGNWNRAVRSSSGAFAMVLSQDDLLEPTAIRDLSTALAESDGRTVVAGGRTRIDANGVELHDRTMVNDREHIWLHRDQYVLDEAELAALCLRNGLAFGEPSAVLFRRDAFDAIGGYNDEFEHAADVDFTLRLAQQGSAVYLRTPVLRRRFHDANLTWSHIRNGATLRDRERLHRDFGASLDRRARSRADVTMVSRGVRDALRGLRWRDGQLFWANAASVGRHCRAAPSHYIEHVREVLAHQNADAR